jgi:uncharacterized protein (TIGR00290 family)
MSKAKVPVFLAWSGGKDCALALFELTRSKDYQVVGLLSCISTLDHTVALRGIDHNLLHSQASAANLPIRFADVCPDANCQTHVQNLGKLTVLAGQELSLDEAPVLAFGDVYLDDIRDCREESLDSVGVKAIFPLWHRDTKELSHTFLHQKFKALVTCIDGITLPQDFLGRVYDQSFLNDLPLTVDPCGENGEFHTVVTQSPNFSKPIAFRPGKQYSKSTFLYQEILTKPSPSYGKTKTLKNRSF